MAQANAAHALDDVAERAVRGGAFFLNAPAHVPAVWGTGPDQVLWPVGESLVIAAPTGVGKTTLLQNLALARCDVTPSLDVLGHMVTPDDRPLLYVAADRPQQIARSGRRMVKEVWRKDLDDRLVVWPGPLPFDVARQPELLEEFVSSFGAGTLIIDSLKDVATGLASDEGGSAVNRAVQMVVASGREVALGTHQRKAQGENRRPDTLADVYGSAWLTAGAGSVIVLWGAAGDPYVEMKHLKQPAGEVGPWKILHDSATGDMKVVDDTTSAEVLAASATGNGLTAPEAAERMYGDTDRAHQQKARRRLDGLVRSGEWERHGGPAPDPVYYRPVRGRALARASATGDARGRTEPLPQGRTADARDARADLTTAKALPTPLRGAVPGGAVHAATNGTPSLDDRRSRDATTVAAVLAAFPGARELTPREWAAMKRDGVVTWEWAA